jgi:integrase
MPNLAAELERHPGIWRGSEFARAGCAESLERAQQLLGHADSKMTQRVYRRKVGRIRPLK